MLTLRHLDRSSEFYQRGRDAVDAWVLGKASSRAKCGQHFALTALRAVQRLADTSEEWLDAQTGYRERMREYATDPRLMDEMVSKR